MIKYPCEDLQYCTATAEYAEQVVGLLGNIDPHTQRYIYGPKGQRNAYLKHAFRCDLGYFGYSRHRLALLGNRCIGMVAAFERREHWLLDIYTLRSLFHVYPLFQALKCLYRLLVSTAASPKPHRGIYFLYNFSIDQTLAGQGVGSWLLQQEIIRARQRGCHYIELDVATTNHRAIRFYEHNGFVVSQHITNRHCIKGFHFDEYWRMSLGL
ncbi:GNAT family N-acetyltransferase [Serratia sp. JSRIV002]|uniref:GNAT family N-acetyltransferase n=1 Tax=Serratia TaxID=613 RepID=UPI001CC18EAB|nr:MULTISPECIES: GNAT family N-acetyltransferase [Serratia]UAN51143.1 GNAT family N-acetyltransferase [Serratia sp. JSRIV002]CAI0807241.1 putative acetyltransferase [Serratia fonticola]